MRAFLVLLFCLSFSLISNAQSDTLKTDSGLKYVILKEGNGWGVNSGSKVLVHYTGWLPNGKEFDTSANGKPLKFKAGVGQVIKGWDEMLLLMQVGDEVEVLIPAKLAYGSKGVLNSDGETFLIPPNTDLRFRMQVVRVDR